MYLFKKLCRLCTNSSEISSTLNHLDSDNIIFLDKLNTIAPGILEPDNKLPNGICLTCIAQLNEAYKFIKQCCKSQEILKLHLQRLENGEIVDRIKLEEDNNTFEFIKVEASESNDCEIEENEKILGDNNENDTDEINSYNFEKRLDNLQESRNDSEPIEVNLQFVKIEENFEFECEDSKSDFQIGVNEDSDYFEANENDDKSENFVINADLKSEKGLKSRYQTNKVYKCEVCGKAFRFNSHYLRHTRIHNNEKPYNCKECDKNFTSTETLERHIFTHSNDKVFMCDICGQTFSVKAYLYTHLRIHRIGKPHKCEICEAAFDTKFNLKVHIRIHTNERPHSCEVCKKAFVKKGDLTRHFRIHVNDRPFKCEICNKGHTQSGNLKIHMRTHGILD